MELIDKQELLKRLRNWRKECASDAAEKGGEAVLLEEGLADAIATVEDAPVVRDVAPVRRVRRHVLCAEDTCTCCELPWNYYMVQNANDCGYFDPMPDFAQTAGQKWTWRPPMNSKILQIIPAPPNMWARWEPEEGEEAEYSPVVCLALVEEDGATCVAPMVAFGNGTIESPMDFSNFGEFEFRKIEEVADGT